MLLSQVGAGEVKVVEMGFVENHRGIFWPNKLGSLMSSIFVSHKWDLESYVAPHSHPNCVGGDFRDVSVEPLLGIRSP